MQWLKARRQDFCSRLSLQLATASIFLRELQGSQMPFLDLLGGFMAEDVFSVLLDHFRDETSPTRLGGGAKPGAVVAMEVFME